MIEWEWSQTVVACYQGRQKLARFNAREFATLIIDILSDAKRRQQGSPVSPPMTSTKDKGEFVKESPVSPSMTPNSNL